MSTAFEPNVALGFACMVLSPLFYGTTYVPIKKYDIKDGMFAQFLMCVGQLVIGIVVAWSTGFPPIYPMAMLAGVLYAVGNALCLPAMEGLGMAIASLVWNTVTCVVGWAIARFGLFGYEVEIPVSNTLNIAGVVIVCIGGVLFTLVQSNPIAVKPAEFDKSGAGAYNPAWEEKEFDTEKNEEEKEQTTTLRKKLISAAMCVVIGFMFGNLLTPVTPYIRNHEVYNSPQDVNSYLFSHFYGAFLASLAVFVGYSMMKRNVPFINPEIACPSVLAGMIYATAVSMFFVANQHLGQVIAFPVISMTPGMVVSAWSIFWFKEIQGRANYIKLTIAYVITVIGVICIVLSRLSF